MIKVNFKDGTTLAFDLNKEDDFKQWQEWNAVKDFQERITGIGILNKKKFHTLPAPRNFKDIQFHAELVFKEKDGIKRQLGERVTCVADDIRLSLMVYTYDDPPPPILSRFDVERVKRRNFSYEHLYGKPVSAGNK